jgi:uncharacterized protein
MTTPSPIGSISWLDLTVPDAEPIRDFYAAVCDWTPSPVNMGGYADYVMATSSGQAVAGVCHKRGVNADVPSHWLPCVTVTNLETSLTHARTRGGTIIRNATSMGSYGTMAIVQDPAGAVIALLQPKAT